MANQKQGSYSRGRTREDEVAALHATLRSIQDEERNIRLQVTHTLSNMPESALNFDLIEAYAYENSIRSEAKLGVLQRLMAVSEPKVRAIEELEARIATMQGELSVLTRYKDAREKRQSGNAPDALDVYDWVVDIGLISDLVEAGWAVQFSPRFWESAAQQCSALLPSATPAGAWEGAVVAVIGLFDKGKTFVLNNISAANLPSGRKVNTRGLSFKHVDMDSGTKLILLDTAGSYAPVKVEKESSVAEKEATELFLMDVVFDIADYFVCVVNDFTSLDQRFLDKISRSLQSSGTKTFREVIIVHNLKEVECGEVLQHAWTSQVLHSYSHGEVLHTTVAALDPATQSIVEKPVQWFKTPYSRHICVANADCPLGKTVNPWAFSLLKYWIKAVFVPVNRPISVIEEVMASASRKLSVLFSAPVELSLTNSTNNLKKFIRCPNDCLSALANLPKIAADSSGLILSRPDSFLPALDILESDEYSIYMDVPGMTDSDFSVARRSSATVVHGNRKTPYTAEDCVVRQERKYGDFTLSFNVPVRFQRRWKKFEVHNGVLRLAYAEDKED